MLTIEVCENFVILKKNLDKWIRKEEENLWEYR